MKFLKNNLKLILACIITAILTGGIVYAATSAGQVTYTTNKNGEVQTVADALNDLYLKSQTNNNISLGTVLTAHSQGNGTGDRKATLNLEKGKYIVSVCYIHGSASTTDDNLNTHEEMEGNLISENNN